MSHPRQLIAALPILVAGCSLPPGEPAAPQRPSFAFTPTTTAAGTWEVDAGLQVGPLDDYVEMPSNWKYGVDERTEAALTVSPLISVDHTAGFGDTGLWLRRRFIDAQGSRPAVALQASAKLPTADEDRGLGTGHADGFGSLIVSGALGSFTWTGFAQLGALGQAHEDADLEADVALMAMWTIDPVNTVFAEFSDRRVPEQDTAVDQWRFGHSITVRPDLILDWSVWLPASDDAPETIFAVGFTRNLGRP